MLEDIQTSKKSFSVRSKVFEGLLIVVALSFAALTFLAKQTPYFALDLAITQAIQKFNPPWFDLLMKVISDIGYPPQSIYIVAGISLILFLISRKKEALLVLSSAIGVTILSETVKTLVSRSRPNPTLINQITSHIRSDSFPSGHVLLFAGVFGFLLYLSFTNIKHSFLRAFLCTLFFLLILLVGISRIYLGDHWFSDVLGAYLLGYLWLSLMIYLYHKLESK